jgi:hypothetical protein
MCLAGFTGSACDRIACPTGISDTTCSGHGTCELANTFAKDEWENIYNLWDEKSLAGCRCDPGYSGPSCFNRRCKAGFDPIFFDNSISYRYSNWSFVIFTGAPNVTIIGNYSIRFFDYHGEDWSTRPIPYDASCFNVVEALESLPNDVIPKNYTRCLKFADYHKVSSADEPGLSKGNYYYGVKYTIAFPKNPGNLRQPEIDIYLDGVRPTLFTDTALYPVRWAVYANGFYGENVENFPWRCIGVDVQLKSSTYYDYLTGLTSLEQRLLARCLGDADNLDSYSATGRVQGNDYTWDYGSKENPHLIRLVDNSASPVTDLCVPAKEDSTNASVRGIAATCIHPRPPGFIVPVYYDKTLDRFILLTRPAADYASTTSFTVFATNGTAKIVSEYARVYTSTDQPYSRTIYTVNSTGNFPGYYGNLDCETNAPYTNGASHCVEKGNTIFVLDPSLNAYSSAANPKYLNLYMVTRAYTSPKNSGSSNPDRIRLQLDKAISGSWSRDNSTDTARVYLFTPPSDGYPHVAECSNRGLCDEETGLCTCFKGYIGDDCSVEFNINTM